MKAPAFWTKRRPTLLARLLHPLGHLGLRHALEIGQFQNHALIRRQLIERGFQEANAIHLEKRIVDNGAQAGPLELVKLQRIASFPRLQRPDVIDGPVPSDGEHPWTQRAPLLVK